MTHRTMSKRSYHGATSRSPETPSPPKKTPTWNMQLRNLVEFQTLGCGVCVCVCVGGVSTIFLHIFIRKLQLSSSVFALQ